MKTQTGQMFLFGLGVEGVWGRRSWLFITMCSISSTWFHLLDHFTFLKMSPCRPAGWKTCCSNPTASWRPSGTPRPTAMTTPAALASTWTSTSTSKEIPSAATSTTTCWKRYKHKNKANSPSIGLRDQIKDGGDLICRENVFIFTVLYVIFYVNGGNRFICCVLRRAVSARRLLKMTSNCADDSITVLWTMW